MHVGLVEHGRWSSDFASKKSKTIGGAYSIAACYGIWDKDKRVETSKAISKRYIKLETSLNRSFSESLLKFPSPPVFRPRLTRRIFCNYDGSNRNNQTQPSSNSVQLYRDFERLLTETVRQSQSAWGGSSDWSQVEGAWVLKPKDLKPKSVVHFVGGIFVGAAPQLTYRLFLERLSEKGVLVIATPYASGFDYFFIADEVQSKFDRCLRFLQETGHDLPTFGIGHSLGSVIHLLIGSRYAIPRSGNVLMAFNNQEASLALSWLSPVLVPMAQSIGPFLSQIASSPTIRMGAEMTLKQIESLSPPIMKQVLPLVEQLPPLYMDLAKGREDFSPKPEEAQRLALPDVPPAMADAVNRGGELLVNLSAGTPWETVAKEVSNTLGVESSIIRAEISKDMNNLVEVITSWMASNSGTKLFRP
ncbi:Gut esterase 1 [Gossypium arboreum]|uniref:Gut esterase 1 n=1 Tax=Gossypium arboreum TaxID=29729 RepID=A0A0B0NG06_GOSAR|nr:Gut esterase 1 [Gossypium arboreum]